MGPLSLSLHGSDLYSQAKQRRHLSVDLALAGHAIVRLSMALTITGKQAYSMCISRLGTNGLPYFD